MTNKPDNLYTAASKAAATDIYPTIARHMDLEIPESMEKEIDGGAVDWGGICQPS